MFLMQVDVVEGRAKNPFQLKYKYRHQKNAQTPQTGKLAGPKTARKYGFTASRKSKINKLLYVIEQFVDSLKDSLP